MRRIVGRAVSSIRATAGNWDSSRPSEGAYAAFLNFDGGACATLTYSGYAHYDSDELVDWVSELGYVKDPSIYGDARRKLANLSAEDEIQAKLSRAYSARGSLESSALPPYHEHFGFILVNCERADFKLSPKRVVVYGDSERRVLDLDPPKHPRYEVLAEFVGAVMGERKPIHDGRWGLETMACCEALLESSRSRREIEPASIIRQLGEPSDP